MRVLVFGAGALGQAVGGLLAESGCDVAMVLRPAAAELLARKGLLVDGIFGRHMVAPERLQLLADLDPLRDASGAGRQPPSAAIGLPGSSPSCAPDYVLVTVKSYDTPQAVQQIRRIDDGRFIIVSLQNGYGNVECLTAAFGPDRVLCGRVITGFVIPQPGRVQITVHADSLTLGRFDGADSPPAEHLAAVMSASGLPTRATRHVHADLWAKILYNCALNPLGAVPDVAYGRLAERAETRELMDRIIEEAYAVMAARGLPRLFATADEFRRAFYQRMVPPTAAHSPSMLQDLRAGKRTEIDALNGAIVRLGREARIDTPINQTVSAMVRFLETR